VTPRASPSYYTVTNISGGNVQIKDVYTQRRIHQSRRRSRFKMLTLGPGKAVQISANDEGMRSNASGDLLKLKNAGKITVGHTGFRNDEETQIDPIWL